MELFWGKRTKGVQAVNGDSFMEVGGGKSTSFKSPKLKEKVGDKRVRNG